MDYVVQVIEENVTQQSYLVRDCEEKGKAAHLVLLGGGELTETIPVAHSRRVIVIQDVETPPKSGQMD